MTPRARSSAAPAKRPAPAKRAPAKRTTPVVDVDEVAGSIDFDHDEAGVPADGGRPAGIVDAEGNPILGGTVKFQNRSIDIQMPDEVQLAVIQMFADEFVKIDEGQEVELRKAISMSRQAIRCIQSVMVDEEDQDWISDQLLSHKIDLQQAMQILTEALELLRINNGITNRETRRAAERGKAKLVTNG